MYNDYRMVTVTTVPVLITYMYVQGLQRTDIKCYGAVNHCNGNKHCGEIVHNSTTEVFNVQKTAFGNPCAMGGL